MEDRPIDRLAQILAMATKRRHVLRGLAGAIAGALLASGSSCSALARSPAARRAGRCESNSDCRRRGDRCVGGRCVDGACVYVAIRCRSEYVCCGNGRCCKR